MSTRHVESATRPSRRKLHISRIHASDPGWERNFQLPAMFLSDLAEFAGRRIVRRRFLAFNLNLLNVLLLGVLDYAALQPEADLLRIVPLAGVIFLALWCGGIYLQRRESHDKVQVTGALPWLNFLLLAVAPLELAFVLLQVQL